MRKTKELYKVDKKSHSKKKKFSSFNTREAHQQLNIKKLLHQVTPIPSSPASEFFKERMARLQRHFDLKTCEDAKKLVIDAVCEEELKGLDDIKIWKALAQKQKQQQVLLTT